MGIEQLATLAALLESFNLELRVTYEKNGREYVARLFDSQERQVSSGRESWFQGAVRQAFKNIPIKSLEEERMK